MYTAIAIKYITLQANGMIFFNRPHITRDLASFKFVNVVIMQSRYGEETEEIAAEELDLDGFFEDDIAPQSSCTITEGPGAGETIYDNSAGLDDSISYGSHTFNTISETTNGFNTAFGTQWIYPSNLPTRSYQYNIVQKALFTNTLVTLPTGLGKTFIAAVVMYNFYRWYPSGKVIFLAPTKPLVAQQVKACYSVMGIPKEHTTEMTGILLDYIFQVVISMCMYK